MIATVHILNFDFFARVKLAVHKETQECVAVKIMSVDENGEGLTHECLRKEVRHHTPTHPHHNPHTHTQNPHTHNHNPRTLTYTTHTGLHPGFWIRGANWEN